MPVNLDFANDTMSSCFFFFSFFFFFLITYIYFLVPAVIAQIFTSIAELIIPIEILSKEAKPEIEIHLIIAEAKIRKCSI